jgi:glycosyltransferase involved in cell wall biosynthesis
VGGAELVVLEVYRRLARRHEVRLLTPVLSRALDHDPGGDDYAGLVPFPVDHYADRVSFFRLRGHRASAGALPPFSLSAVAALRNAVRRFRPDVVNVHYAVPTGLAAAVADRLLGVPTVVTMNGRDVPGPGVPRLWRAWERAVLACVSDVTYVSGYCQAALYGSKGARGRVVYNGVEIPPPPGDGARIRGALGVRNGAPVVFALQRLSPEKRVDVLLHALGVCHGTGDRATLVIGGTGPEGARLRALSAKLGLERHVRFAGYIPRAELGSYFLACDVFAFHSTYETFGLTVAQAMSYGRPVVTVRNTALPEVLGDAGVLVETGDAAALGDAVARLLADGPLRSRLGAAGRARAERLFNWDRVAEQYEAVLAGAADGGACAG